MTATLMRNTGVQKGAVVLAALGTELAVKVLQHLDEAHVEPLVRQMTELGYVPAGERDSILKEFHQRLDRDAGLFVKGKDYTRGVLEQTMGAERAALMLGDPLPEKVIEPITLDGLLEQMDPPTLADCLADEHPQLIALVLSRLPVDRAAAVLSALPGDARVDVVSRMVHTETPSDLALEQIRQLLLEKSGSKPAAAAAGGQEGPKRVAEILGRMRRATEDSVIADLEQRSPEVARKVNKHRFTFSDFLGLDGRALQRVLRDVDADTLRLAMKGLTTEQQEVLFSNMSERGAARLREDLENTGPTRLSEVEGAQQSIIAKARSLADQGEIRLSLDAESEEEALV